MSVALDFGSSEFRSLHRHDNRLVARRLPAVYTVVEDQPAHRRLLEQLRVPFSESDDALILVGAPAQEVAALLSRPLIPVLPGGLLPKEDHLARQICAWMVDSLVAPATPIGTPCVATAGTIGRHEPGGLETTEFLAHLVRLRGYGIELLPQAGALCLSELEDHGYTGLALCVGAETVSVNLSYHGATVFQGTLGKGIRPLISKLAQRRQQFVWDQLGNAYADTHRVEQWLAKSDIQLNSPTGDDESWFAGAVGELLLSAWITFKRKVRWVDHPVFRHPLPVVTSGGISLCHGFAEVVRESLALSEFPVTVAEVRQATFDPYSVARGLLIHGAVVAGDQPRGIVPREVA